MFHPQVIGHSPPAFSTLPLAAWRSLRASLYLCTRCEIVTWVVTEIIWKRRSLQTRFRVTDDPSVPPTMLAATWSIRSLPSFPRGPTLSTAKVASSSLRSSKDTCLRRA